MSSPTPNRPARNAAARRRGALSAGFSLVELMVVVVIMAVMAAMILPAMRGTMEAERLRGAGRQILQSLHLAYSQSITQGQPHRWHYDPVTGNYQVERPDRDASGAAPFAPVTGLPESHGCIVRDIQVEIRPATAMAAFDLDQNQPAAPALLPGAADDDNAVAFFPDGTAQAKEIVLSDRAGFRQTLRVNPATAQVTLVATREREGARP